jgi:hypothetical protein
MISEGREEKLWPYFLISILFPAILSMGFNDEKETQKHCILIAKMELSRALFQIGKWALIYLRRSAMNYVHFWKLFSADFSSTEIRLRLHNKSLTPVGITTPDE